MPENENMRTACLSVFFILVMVAGLTLNAFGQSDNKKPWELDQFTIFIWPFKTDVLKDYGLYRELGLGGFQIDRGRGQQERIRFSRENDFPFYAGHVADKGYLYLKGDDKDAVMKKSGLLTRPVCLADPDVIQQMKAHIRDNITDLKNGRAVAYALDDEISLNSGFVMLKPPILTSKKAL